MICYIQFTLLDWHLHQRLCSSVLWRSRNMLIIINNRVSTAVLSLVRPISTILFSITLPYHRDAAIVRRSTAKLWRRRAVGDASLGIIRQVEEVRTSARELVESRCNQAQVWTSTVVCTTWVCNYTHTSNIDYFSGSYIIWTVTKFIDYFTNKYLISSHNDNVKLTQLSLHMVQKSRTGQMLKSQCMALLAIFLTEFGNYSFFKSSSIDQEQQTERM